ncbi:hypothetical protein ACJIZ3_004945 [Penstemon smallii]|uniref:Uncharacterized protein n=1 Tax=Penstemon smallii TaxID=265156 RepID=A0ABD3S3N2_9LAMI
MIYPFPLFPVTRTENGLVDDKKISLCYVNNNVGSVSWKKSISRLRSKEWHWCNWNGYG